MLSPFFCQSFIAHPNAGPIWSTQFAAAPLKSLYGGMWSPSSQPDRKHLGGLQRKRPRLNSHTFLVKTTCFNSETLAPRACVYLTMVELFGVLQKLTHPIISHAK